MHNFNDLINLFKEINNQGYIQGINNNKFNSCGLTFEHLLNKKADSMYFPDFNNIEIKCTQRFSRYAIGLFSISFDGPYLYESNYLLEKYGFPDKKYPEKKVLWSTLKYHQKILVNDYYFELDIDKEKIYLNIYDLNNNLIDQQGFIYLNNIETRLKVKLQNLALIYGSKKQINDNLFFRYYKIECYELKDFNTFIDLIKNNIIKVSILLRFSKSNKDFGENKNKNINFSINKYQIFELFNKIYTYEN